MEGIYALSTQRIQCGRNCSFAFKAGSVEAIFTVLLYYGSQIYQEKPPTPNQVITDTGKVIYTKNDILEGQKIWKIMGVLRSPSPEQNPVDWFICFL
jgi:hypothetical protein